MKTGFQRLIHARAFRSPMGKGTKKSSAQDVLFYELSRCARDANAAQALLAFDAAAGTVSGAFQARIYHKLLALLVDRPSDSARARQHMDERGVERDETMVPPSSLLPHRVPAAPHGELDTIAAGDAGGARSRPRRRRCGRRGLPAHCVASGAQARPQAADLCASLQSGLRQVRRRDCLAAAGLGRTCS